MDKKEAYWKLSESERHFNELQAGIRNRASTWLLAAFTAIAVLIKTGGETGTVWLVPSSILIGLVCLMGTIGLLVLWINDQMVYHRLLNSVFLVGLKMEHDDPSLPPVKAMMMHSAEGTGMYKWLSYYYLIPNLFFLLITISIAILHQEIDTEKTKYIMSEGTVDKLFLLFILMQASILVWMQKTKSKVTAQQRASLFGDERFEDIFHGSDDECMMKLGRIIKNHHLYKVSQIKAAYESEQDKEKGKET